MSAPVNVLVDTNAVWRHHSESQWVVLGELYYGAQRAHRKQEQLTYVRDRCHTACCRSLTTTPPRITARSKPNSLSWANRFRTVSRGIAATAQQQDLPLATRDAHFAQMPRLRTFDW